MLLPEADTALAWTVAERILKTIRGIDIHGVQLTASIGAAATDQVLANSANLLSTADQALYCAKRAGRDRVALWVVETPMTITE